MTWLESLWHDARHVLRSLRRQPGFAAAAVLTLALGIGANTAIFSVIDTLLLRAPGIEHLGRLVSLRERNLQKIPFAVNLSPGNFLDWRGQTHSFDEVIRRIGALPGVRGASAISYRPFLRMGTGTSVDVEGRAPSSSGDQPSAEYRVVTPGFIRVIGQPLVEGRDFTEHDGAEAAGVAIVNERWRGASGPTKGAIGRRVRPAYRRTTVRWELDAEARWLTVVGVVRDIKGVAATDPLTFVGAASLLVAIVLAAGYLPARRAARLDPTEMLRGQT